MGDSKEKVDKARGIAAEASSRRRGAFYESVFGGICTICLGAITLYTVFAGSAPVSAIESFWTGYASCMTVKDVSEYRQADAEYNSAIKAIKEFESQVQA